MKRSIQIKELFEEKRPKAIENTKKAKEKQIEITNKRINPTTEKIPIGTTVKIKVEGLKGKLENRYRGRFFIHDYTRVGNYILKNTKGEILKEHFAASKLKPVLEDEELEKESEEIKEILDHKTEKGKIKYLVRWKDEKLENEWVNEDNFDTVEIINEYYKKIHRREQEESHTPIEKRRGRKKTNFKINYLTILLMVIYNVTRTIGLAEQIDKSNTYEIKGNYRYCEPTQRIVDLDENCLPKEEAKTRSEILERNITNQIKLNTLY